MNLRNFFISFAALAFTVLATGAGAPTAAMQRPSLSGLAGVALHAHDLTASRAYYRDYLGFAEQRESTDTRRTWFTVNDRQKIELRTELTPGSDRLGDVGLITNDAEGMRQYLKARGYPVPAALDWEISGDRSFTVSDPDGHLVGFVQHTPESWTGKMRDLAPPPSRIAPRIRHAGFMVADLAVSLRFYHDLLGFTEIWRGSADDKTLSWVNLKVPDGDEYLELMLYDPTNPPDADLVRLFSRRDSAQIRSPWGRGESLLLDGVEPTPKQIADGTYFIHRTVNAVTKGPPSGAAKAFVDFLLTREGQQLVVDAGFLAYTPSSNHRTP